jgi:hypothetical protein
MNRKFVLVLVLATASIGGVWGMAAQEYEGFIKPTFSGGLVARSNAGKDDTLYGVGLDVDFVHSTGVTFALQNTGQWNDDTGLLPLTSFGAGYTYDGGLWCAGVKAMTVFYGYGGMGINAGGTWWFTESLGLTALADYCFSMGSVDWDIASIRVGISALF